MFGRLMIALAVLVFLIPAAYLVAVLSRKAPPSDQQVELATIEIVDDAYHVTVPGRLSYVIDPGIGGPDLAREKARSQAADDRTSYDHLWGNFWFLLGGALLASALILLIRRIVIADGLSPMTELRP
jgi:hypothetical protein